MNPTRRRTLRSMAAFGIAPTLAFAQDAWPARPVRIIVPFAAGATSDAVKDFAPVFFVGNIANVLLVGLSNR